MALKNNWNDLVDGESFVEVEPINRIAHAVIANEENILSVQKLGESIQADNNSQETKINELSEDLIRFESDAVRRDSKINENEKRITNLEKGIPSDLFLTDSSIAYSKNVPENALPYAEVKNIGGVTRKCTNLCKRIFDGSNVTISDGVVTQVTADTATSLYVKVVTYAGDSLEKNISVPASNIGGISLTFDKTNATVLYFGINGSAIDTTVTMDISHLPAGTYTIGANFTNLTQGSISWKDTMLNEGSTALPYEPYFEGLRSAPVTEVESVGVNKFGGDVLADMLVEQAYATKNDSQKVVRFGPTYQVILYNEFKPNTRYTIIARGFNEYGNGSNLAIYYTDGSYDLIVFSAVNTPSTAVFYTNATKSVKGFGTITYASYTTLYYNECGIFEGVLTAEDFKPYVRNTLPIPEAVRPKHGINEEVYDYIEWAEDGSVKKTAKCGEVDLGTLTWIYQAGNNRFLAEISGIKNSTDITISDIVCGKYTPSVRHEDKTSFHYLTRIYIIDNAYTDVASFKAAVSGVMLVYELATPVVTDISDLLPEDNFIGVEGNGTITMINQYKYNVPSEIVFMLNEV